MKALLLFIFLTGCLLGLVAQDSPTFYTPRKDSPIWQQKSADHSKFEVLQKDFDNPHALTAACLSCHTERGKEVMQTAHWKWEREAYIEGRGITSLGKNNLLNNFCTGIGGSWGTCTRCHIGYGYEDQKTFDFKNEFNIDCLVCHDNSGTYRKGSGMAGYPDPSVDLGHVARNVGLPSRENCGTCHFHSAGGNNVKNGTLDMALLDCSPETDVHMTSEGADMNCVECHETEKHQMKGKYYGVSSMNRNRASCTQCHSLRPHINDVVNEHTIKVACQTCHIPTYAKVNSTKTSWDWSTATKLNEEGEPFSLDDTLGNHTYLSIKGSFTWGNDLVPDYIWFNGTADHYLITDIIDTFPVQINTLKGKYADEEAKIHPVKIHPGTQPWDPELKRLIQMKVWDKEPGKGALWVDFDYYKAIEEGMKSVEIPWSGKHDFIHTEMTLLLSHMVAPKEQALTCKDCHTREDGRLAGLNDFYMPGRNYNASIEKGGILLIILSLIGVIIHGGLRIFFAKKH
ncbi:MAG: tetrathionate reductase family octaheme c-type cytochrome [Bacteroidia bacterium]|nr:tetrathionate reductase family octaheme c-type cytochrome [Bacteroidales bacterium]NCD40543.1 tetrathionate reductase family octaheme c-type cytochrome [Bacteroidia bacterium]MDD2321990.1 tetrathionate reductase family octaheme c-type cytochrome [Bacteroidales bacterium]MDD3010053.1 tetrathionate reductase family octaheme c-type cytochrome [Bacteroidales bacterium]MDD3960844.1 tetrathionate reductase family octaheme c-type cytochrome [Bacteroidales bacterium]